MTGRDNLKRKERWILLSIGGVLLISLLYFRFFSPSSAHFQFPVEHPFPETNMISDAQIWSEDLKSMAIPRSEYPKLAALFAGGRRDPRPMKWVGMFNIKLTVEEQPISVAVYDAGGLCAFRIGTNYFRGGNRSAFDGFLNDMKRLSESKPQ